MSPHLPFTAPPPGVCAAPGVPSKSYLLFFTTQLKHHLKGQTLLDSAAPQTDSITACYFGTGTLYLYSRTLHS